MAEQLRAFLPAGSIIFSAASASLSALKTRCNVEALSALCSNWRKLSSICINAKCEMVWSSTKRMSFSVNSKVDRQLMRGATKVIMPQMQQVQQGQSPNMDGQLLAAFCQALAGFLFIVPGVLTDGFAVLLLLPPIQKLFQRQMHMACSAQFSFGPNYCPACGTPTSPR